jgi:hypothetical protein
MRLLSKVLLALSFIASISCNTAYAANATDWECLDTFVVPTVSPSEETLREIAHKLLVFRFNNTPNTLKYQSDSNLLTIIFKKPANDVKRIGITFKRANGGNLYVVFYEYANKNITLLDILNRYGAELIEVKTASDLSKSIEIMLKKDTLKDYDTKHPLYFTPTFLGKDDFISLKFVSADKVFVNDVVFGLFKKDKE